MLMGEENLPRPFFCKPSEFFVDPFHPLDAPAAWSVTKIASKRHPDVTPEYFQFHILTSLCEAHL
jgi:hypothetical protein